MRHNVIFGGVDFAENGVWLSGSGTFSAPQRDVTMVSVPGRNGDLIIDNGKWNNITVTYPCFIRDNFDQNMAAFRSLMCSKLGYQKLEDSYHPDEYRLGAFSEGLFPTMRQRNKGGEFDVVFNCKPQRFLKSGETPIQFMPFCISNGVYSKFLPIPPNTAITIQAHCAPADTLTITLTRYDEDLEETTVTTHTCEDGDGFEETFDLTDKYWQMHITGHSDIDTTWLRVQTVTEYNGEALPIDAIMCREFSLVNPTGYGSKPLIEVFGETLGYMTIENRNAAEEMESRYVFTMSNTGKQHFYMDCDMQYVYADDKTNLTGKLFLTTMESDIGQGLVFPDLGTDQIGLYMYFTDKSIDTGIGLIQIYPRWWKL